MRAIAFAPGHLSGFFEPVYHENNMEKTGSRGAGINISLGATSEVTVKYSKRQFIEIYINNIKSECSVINLAIKNLIDEKPLYINVKTNLDLPFSQGFGMSAASAVSTTYALSKIIKTPINKALKASHLAEVELKTGLGDVISCCFGGIEVRKQPGIPPWGIIERILGNKKIVLCVIDKKINTNEILTDLKKLKNIVKFGNYCTRKLIEFPNLENLFLLSKFFTKETNLATKRILEAINAASEFGIASMCMLGNSIFAMGNTNELYTKLKNFGDVFICNIDKYGARIITE